MAKKKVKTNKPKSVHTQAETDALDKKWKNIVRKVKRKK